MLEPVRGERGRQTLRRERGLSADTGDVGLQVRVPRGLQRHRQDVQGRVRQLLREQGHVRQGPARPAVLPVRGLVHRAALRGQVGLRVHRRRHRGHRHIPDRHRAVRVDDMRPVRARQGAQEADGPGQQPGPERVPGELLLRRGAVRRVHRAVASLHVRALLRRRGGRLGDAQLLQRDVHER